jgi:signal transduction histidine kinase
MLKKIVGLLLLSFLFCLQAMPQGRDSLHTKHRPPQQARGSLNSQVKLLIDRSKASFLLKDKESGKALYNEALKLAASSKTNALYFAVKIGYAESLLSVNDKKTAVAILDSLATEPSLSANEQMHVLSLLIINSIKLNITKNLNKYYAQLQSINSSTQGKIDQPEYLLAVAMYQDSQKDDAKAAAGYQLLHSKFENAVNGREQVTEALIRHALILSRQFKRDSAEYYFKKAAKNIKADKHLAAAAIEYTQAYNEHQQRYNRTDKLISSMQSALVAKDTNYHRDLVNATKELEYKYKLIQSAQKLKLSAQQRQLDELTYTRNRQRSLLIILSLLVLVIAAGALSYVLYQRRRQMKIMHQVQLADLEHTHHVEVVKVLSNAQEEERKRIAGQLHDEVGTMLAVARLNLSVLDKYDINPATISPDQLKTVNHILGDVADTIREMSHELMPVAIRQLGFKQAILQLVDDINSAHKLYIDCVIVGLDDKDRYPLEFQTNVYRIIQELFQNIIKHANATGADFQLVEHSDELNIMVEDNGKGIDLKAYIKGKGIEMLSNRIDLYNGRISIEGGDKTGTLIIIDIPLQNIVSSKSKSDLEHGETIPG